MFEVAVDGFGGTACGVRVINVGQVVHGSAFECPAQCDDFREGARDDRVAETGCFGLHRGLARTRVGRAVGVDDVLVDTPGNLECDVAIAGEQVEYAVLLTQREQA